MAKKDKNAPSKAKVTELDAKVDLKKVTLTTKELMKLTKNQLLEIAEKFNVTQVKSLTKPVIIERILNVSKKTDEKNNTKISKTTNTEKEKPKTIAAKPKADNISEKEDKIKTKVTKKENEKDTSKIIEPKTENVQNDKENKYNGSKLDVFDNKELPYKYNETKAVLLVRDPHCIFAYWEISEQHVNHHRLGIERELVMRLADVTNIEKAHENNYNWYTDYTVGGASNWYIHVNEPDKEYQIVLGYFKQDGQFIPIVVSNRVRVPKDKVSDKLDEEWLDPNIIWEKIFQYSGGIESQEDLNAITGASMKIAARRMEFKLPDSWSFSEGLLKKQQEKVK